MDSPVPATGSTKSSMDGPKKFRPARPVRRGPAAPGHEPDPAGEFLSEQRIDPLHMFGGRCDELASRKEKKPALHGPGLMAGKSAFVAVAERHVPQGKVVSGRRHLPLVHHGFAGAFANQPHVQIFGTDLPAQPAETARIDELVRMAVAHDDGKVIVDLAHVLFGISAKSVEIFTDLDAFETLALQTSCGLAGSFFLANSPAGVRLPAWPEAVRRPPCSCRAWCELDLRRCGRPSERPFAGTGRWRWPQSGHPKWN